MKKSTLMLLYVAVVVLALCVGNVIGFRWGADVERGKYEEQVSEYAMRMSSPIQWSQLSESEKKFMVGEIRRDMEDERERLREEKVEVAEELAELDEVLGK